MSKRFKIIAMVLTCLLVVCSTMFGVLAAKKISSMPLEIQVSQKGLNKQISHVGMYNLLVNGEDEQGLRRETIIL